MKKRLLGIGLPLLACLAIASCGGGSDVPRTAYSSEEPISSSEESREYEITWEDYDGSVLRVDSLAYGDLPYYGADPEREGDAQYSYAFSNWEPSIEAVTGDATYKAVYTCSTNQYEITWEDYDGSVLRVDSVPYGETPSYGLDAPERDDYAGPYDCWVFDGWYPDVEAATSDATYTATYSKQACTDFTIRYDANCGSDWVPDSQKKKRGEPLKLNIFRTPYRKGYHLYGWNNLYDGKVYHDGDELTLDMNLTMYAMWIPICPICGGDGHAEKTICPECEGKGYFCPYCNEPLIESYEHSGSYTYGYCSSCGKQVYKYGMDAYSSKVFFDEKVMCANCQGKGYLGFDGDCDKIVLEDAPTVSKREARSITLKYASGYEYSIDGGEYQSSNVFDGLLPHTAYTFRQRRATSGGVPFGIDSKELTVTTTDDSSYYVTYELNGGKNDSRNPATYKRSATSTPLYAPSKEGYDFAGWSYNDEIVSEIKGSWNVDITLEATWTPTGYTITYDLDGGVNASSNPDSYTIESESFAFSDPTKAGYSFVGWYSDANYSNKVDGIASGSTGDVMLYAKWSANKNSLSVTSEDESKGSVSVSGEGYSGEEITVTANPVDGYVLSGWYSDGALLSRSNPYIFQMPVNGYSLTAEFCTEEEHRKLLGIDPAIDLVNNTMTYGLYPQSRVSDPLLLSRLAALKSADSNGWYLLNGEYYAKSSAMPYKDNYTFDDGATIVEGTTYWFKCEPITWKIAEITCGKYSLVSTVLLDKVWYNHAYSGYKNEHCACDFSGSEIEEWLNGDFRKSAFFLGDSALTGQVDILSSFESDYKCFDTKVCYITDWARAKGGICFTNSSIQNRYSSHYWTRTQYNDLYTTMVDIVAAAGNFSYAGVASTHVCVRPRIYIDAAYIAKS